jgi:hypothetical protein
MTPSELKQQVLCGTVEQTLSGSIDLTVFEARFRSDDAVARRTTRRC